MEVGEGRGSGRYSGPYSGPRRVGDHLATGAAWSLRITHYTGIAWDMLCEMAKREREDGDRRHTAAELGVSNTNDRGHDLLKLLTMGDVILSSRGTRGGYQLAHAPRDITLLQVAQAVEMSNPPSPPDSHFLIVERHVKKAMARVTLADSLAYEERDE